MANRAGKCATLLVVADRARIIRPGEIGSPKDGSGSAGSRGYCYGRVGVVLAGVHHVNRNDLPIAYDRRQDSAGAGVIGYSQDDRIGARIDVDRTENESRTARHRRFPTDAGVADGQGRGGVIRAAACDADFRNDA